MTDSTHGTAHCPTCGIAREALAGAHPSNLLALNTCPDAFHDPFRQEQPQGYVIGPNHTMKDVLAVQEDLLDSEPAPESQTSPEPEEE